MVAIMFTVEMNTSNGESTTIITLDSTGQYDDVKLEIFDDVVFITQEDDHDMGHSIIISPQQWYDFVVAMQATEGAYYVERNDDLV
jgi:hypothetical protein